MHINGTCCLNIETVEIWSVKTKWLKENDSETLQIEHHVAALRSYSQVELFITKQELYTRQLSL
jgi:hypothetical protein